MSGIDTATVLNQRATPRLFGSMAFSEATSGPSCKDANLSLPRILCLHGGGTNSRIFQIQCRSITQRLSGHLRLIFAEAPFPARRPGPDVTAVFSEYRPFRQWLFEIDGTVDEDACALEAASLIRTALLQAIKADDMLGATGEVIGLLGFSQGARMAASLLYNQQICRRRVFRSDFHTWPVFRFAIVLAGRGRLIWLANGVPPPAGTVSPLTRGISPLPVDDAPDCDGLQACDRLYLPTLHVHGLNDDGLELHRKLVSRYCLRGTETVLEWEGSHRVPIKSKDVSAVVEQIFRLAAYTGVS